MTASPRVTVVIPVFNGANYLSQAIESALAQDFDVF
jgi:glycosyltransferase involved in cell wall biosynthesis